MKYAVIKDGVVINTIIAPENYNYPFEGEAIPSDEAGIGWSYKEGTFSPPPVPKEGKEGVPTTKEDKETPPTPFEEDKKA